MRLLFPYVGIFSFCIQTLSRSLDWKIDSEISSFVFNFCSTNYFHSLVSFSCNATLTYVLPYYTYLSDALICLCVVKTWNCLWVHLSAISTAKPHIPVIHLKLCVLCGCRMTNELHVMFHPLIMLISKGALETRPFLSFNFRFKDKIHKGPFLILLYRIKSFFQILLPLLWSCIYSSLARNAFILLSLIFPIPVHPRL